MNSQNKCEIPIVEGVHVISAIGKGHFSKVYKGVELKENTVVAVKVIEKNDLNKSKVDVIISEIGIMKSLNHLHIVRLKDFKWDYKSVYIILEYCEGGNLYDYIKFKNRLKESVCKRALQQLASGLAYLRSKNICHMDLKPQNILIKLNPFTIKIADFGLAQYLPEKNYKDNLRGSPLYMAPEILLSNKYTAKVDLWSVGIILYECLFGKPPLAHKNLQELIVSLKNESPIKYPSTVPISKDCRDLLGKLLTYNPEKRISYEDFFNHPFIDLVHAPTDENKKLAFKIIKDAVKFDEKKNYMKAFNLYCRALRYLIPLLETMSASDDRAYLQYKVAEYLARAEELKSVLFKDTLKTTDLKQKLACDDLDASLKEVDKLVSNADKHISSLISSDSSHTSHTEPSREEPLINESGAPSSSNQVNDQNEQKTSSKHLPNQDLCDTGGSMKSLPEDLFSSQLIKESYATSSKIHSALDIGFSGQMYMMQGDYDIAYSKYETSLSILIAEVKGFPPGGKRDFLLLLIKKWLSEAESAKTLASAKSVNLAENHKTSLEALDSNCTIQ